MQLNQILGMPTCSLTSDPPTLTTDTLASPLLPRQEPRCPRAFAWLYHASLGARLSYYYTITTKE